MSPDQPVPEAPESFLGSEMRLSPGPGGGARILKFDWAFPELSEGRKGRILVVDDDESIRKILTDLLTLEGYEVTSANNGEDGLRIVSQAPPDLLLVDVMMPGIDGIEVCRRMKAEEATRLIPVIILTAKQDRGTRVKGLEAGADDFLAKPFSTIELKVRVRSLLRLKRYTDELENVDSVLFSLARSVEAKDLYTKDHCERLAAYSMSLGRRMGLSPAEIMALGRGGILHDLGKVGIPESILLKPGKLTVEEFEIMKQHTVIGEQICQPLRSLRLVLPIIRSHHERWNGSGYPDGLAGDAIPLTARILQVTDVFDALTTDRPYRSASTPQEAFAILRSEVDKGWLEEHIVEGFYEMLQGEDERTPVFK